MKKFIEEPSRKIEIITETDVLVVGSGPGGLAAALAAARTGVKVVLVERFGCFGGNITAAATTSPARGPLPTSSTPAKQEIFFGGYHLPSTLCSRY